MTHFLFLEKGAQMRDTQRAPREKVAGDSAPAVPLRPGEPTDSVAGPGLLYLVLPMGDGYRVFRAPLEEVADLPMPADREGGQGRADSLERFLASANGEVLGRLRAPSRRVPSARRESASSQLPEHFGEVEIDVAARVVHRRGEVIPLAPMEFDLLLSLTRRDGAAASRRDLLREVWGTTKAVSLRTVDTHVSNLRRKLEDDPSSPRHILTVKKVGYRLQR